MQDFAEDWYGPDAATFGDRVSAAREQAGLSQSDLAKRLGVKAKTIREWEQDLSEPRANRLSILSGILNVTITWLITGEGEGVSQPGEEHLLTPEITEILQEIRDVRTVLRRQSDKLGVLEKKLRQRLVEDIA